MGISKMQGMAAHIEYIKKTYDDVKHVNCKFWNNEICYNEIAFRYGDSCYTKRGCMYSIPITKNEVRGKKGRKVNAVSSLDKSTNIINNNYEVKAYMLIKKKTVNCVFDNTKLVIREVKIKKFKDKKYRVSSGFIKIKAKVCTKCGKVFLNSLDQQNLNTVLGNEYAKQESFTSKNNVSLKNSNVTTKRTFIRVKATKGVSKPSYFENYKSGILPVKKNSITSSTKKLPKGVKKVGSSDGKSEFKGKLY
ncbi:hypothetical protein [Clostridium celatum]|uniref:hypothetical protein n=1 Tax=Clostridium celatum TaxID=36834 RepID=UPI002908FE03|nr:hypothetical protein [Clostridium celatum]MDU6296194.1 hypothetical protein [Clostridium celatum]